MAPLLIGFNEAGARTPQKARRPRRNRLRRRHRFNEAGARTPQKVPAGGIEHDGDWMLQ